MKQIDNKVSRIYQALDEYFWKYLDGKEFWNNEDFMLHLQMSVERHCHEASRK